MSDSPFCPIDEALAELKAGRMVVLVDDEHRENEGDVIMAAEAITPEAVNFMIRHACGRLCVSMGRAVADQLDRFRIVDLVGRLRRNRPTNEHPPGADGFLRLFPGRAQTASDQIDIKAAPHAGQITTAPVTLNTCAPVSNRD